jgi:glycosyltransferase involved in cell wall biosynthesis
MARAVAARIQQVNATGDVSSPVATATARGHLGAPRRVVFVNRYCFPDVSATSQMLSDLLRALCGSGFELHVVCSRQLYDNPNAHLAHSDRIAAVHVHRVGSTRFGRWHLLGRALDYASFYLSSAAALLEWTRAGDIVVAMTDPPLLSIPAAVVARARRAYLINWLQDMFPEIAVSLGVPRLPRWLTGLLHRMRNWSLRAAEHNVVIGVGMYHLVCRLGVPLAKQRLIQNWADSEAVSPRPGQYSSLRRTLSPQPQFVVQYSGNLGRAHEYQTILQAAEALQSEAGWLFLMIGGGVNMQQLRAEVERGGLTNFCFLPYQPREGLADSLAAADVHLSCLLPSLEGLVVPSKFYGILAAGRPVIVIGDPDGEQARIVRAENCGAVLRTGDGAGLADELRQMRRDPDWLRQAGERARALYERRYTLEKAGGKWLAILRDVESRHRV